MNSRKPLDNLDTAIQERWGSTERCPCLTTLHTLAGEWEKLRPARKRLQAEKGVCSRRIGDARLNGGDATALLTEMAEISERLARLEAERKRIETEVEALFAQEQSPLLPPRFLPVAETPPQLPVRVVECEGTEDGSAWDAFVESHPAASLYHRYQWRHIIASCFGHETRYWRAVDAAGATAGVLPMVRLTSRLFGNFAVSMPYFNYGGILASSETARLALWHRARHYAENEKLGHIELREMAPATGLPGREEKASMIRRLPTDTEALDREVGAKVRSQIKQARRHAPTVAIGSTELLDEFYRVFAVNMRDLGTPVYSKRFFATILEQWHDRAHIVVIRAPEAVAGAFLLGYRDMLEIPWASTLRAANPMNMNMLLYWEVLSLAIEKGYGWFDFGRSSIGGGTYQFKKQWGAIPVQHYWNYWVAQGRELPQINPNNPKYRLAIDLWRRLPVAMTKLLGPPIVKYLP